MQAQIHLLALSVRVALSATSQFQSLFKPELPELGYDFEKPELYIFAQTSRKTLEAAKRSSCAEKPRVLHF